ncbi:MAG: YegS/Rv2252/BmrU family lipid kinase, partial [Myxococcales bacterium]|nr:YegS/Rv2252/BmrU family lipid kinase [Myxococcales bacterium]
MFVVSEHVADGPVGAALLRAPGGAREIVVCGSPDAVEQAATEAAAGGASRVVAVGGDGTVRAVVQGLLAVRTPRPELAIVPAGTANDAARGLGLDDPFAVLERLEAGTLTPHPLDVNVCNGQCSVNVLSIGTPARVTQATPQESKALLGGLAYVLQGITQLAETRPFRARLHADGLQWEGSALALYIGNLPYAGGGFRVCPDADCTDGLLDLLIVPEMEPGELLALFGDTALLGDPRHHELVEHHRFTSLAVDL